MVTDKAVTSVLRVFLVLGAFVALIHSKSVVKPVDKYFNICSRGNPKGLNECVKKNLNIVQTHMSTGIPSLKILPMDPFFIPKAVFHQDGSIPLETTLTNATVTGLMTGEDWRVTSIVTDKKFEANVTLTVPDFKIRTHYDLKGQFLLIPIQGNGIMEENVTNLEIGCRSVSKVVTLGGKRHLEVDYTKCSLEVRGKLSLWFYNLYNGDEVLGNATNTFLNEHYLEAHESAKHMPESLMAEVMKSTMNNVFGFYTFDELFPL